MLLNYLPLFTFLYKILYYPLSLFIYLPTTLNSNLRGNINFLFSQLVSINSYPEDNVLGHAPITASPPSNIHTITPL